MFDGILDISNKFSPFNRVLFDQPKTRRKKKLNHFDVPIETKCAIDVLNIETMDDFYAFNKIVFVSKYFWFGENFRNTLIGNTTTLL